MDENRKRPEPSKRPTSGQKKKVKRKKTALRLPATSKSSRPPVRREPQRSTQPRQPKEQKSRDELRQEKYLERQRIRRRNKLISYSVGALLVLAVAVIIVISVFFKISSIKVVGDEVYTQQEIITASNIKVGDNMFSFNKNNVCSSVQEKLPYVEQLTIKRSPTGKITFTVKAANAAMAIENGGEYIVLNSSCKVLEEHCLELKESTAWVKCSPTVSAVCGTQLQLENEDDIEVLSRIAKLLEEYGIKKVTGITVLDYTNIKLNYDNRINLKVGSLTTFTDNIDFIKATLERQDAEEPDFTGAIDFTITDRAFVNEVDEDEATTVPSEIVTDENGEKVTDEDGKYVTEQATENSGEVSGESDGETEQTTAKKKSA